MKIGTVWKVSAAENVLHSPQGKCEECFQIPGCNGCKVCWTSRDIWTINMCLYLYKLYTDPLYYLFIPKLVTRIQHKLILLGKSLCVSKYACKTNWTKNTCSYTLKVLKKRAVEDLFYRLIMVCHLSCYCIIMKD